MVAIWLFSGWVGTHWGWKGLFRIPVVFLGVMSIAYFFLVKSHPRQIGLLNYEEQSSRTRNEERTHKSKGIRPYLDVLRNYRFDLACLTVGTANFARYSFTVWIPLYYYEVGGFPLERVALICLALPLGMSIGPSVAGWISDRFFKAKRYPVIVIFLFISALSTLALSFVPPARLLSNQILLFVIGFSIFGLLGPIYALSADIAGENRVDSLPYQRPIHIVPRLL